MTPEAMSALHATAFDRAWPPEEIAALLKLSTTFYTTTDHGFALAQLGVEDADVLTIVVAPEARRTGQGAALIGALIDAAQDRGAQRIVLEVAEDNTAALRLYARCGFKEVGRRPKYYPRSSGAVDALVLAHIL